MAQTVYNVSQVNAYIKNIFEHDYALRQIFVRGEVSNCKYSGPGHIYFSLKDETGLINCVMFAGKRAAGLKFLLENGQKVIANGSVMVYEKTGAYQLYASGIVLDGVGDLYRQFEETKKRLEEMGMFAPEYKKPIVKYASRIGIVTAASGAAIQDIINISTRRNPYVQLYLYPSAVQGEMAVPTIVRGIKTLDGMGLDTIIVGRGGGSIEDLWAYNEEEVAKAIFDAHTPIISAVGHETDFTIADFVSDLRAPTPSAAAELAVFDYSAFTDSLITAAGKMKASLNGSVQTERLKLQGIKSRIEKNSPGYKLEMRRQALINDRQALSVNILAALETAKNSLKIKCAGLNAKNPLDRLKGGFGYVSGPDGKAVKSISEVEKDDNINIVLSDGRVLAKVLDKKENPKEES